MFTGIVERTVKVQAVANGPDLMRLTLAADWSDVKHGESIAVNGCCLTVAEIMPGQLGFDVIAETLGKTNLGLLKANDQVNVERSLRVGDRIDGHFVQGHIDGTARLVDTQTAAGEWRMTIDAPPELSRYLVPKGSVCIDGVSLTIASLQANQFQVALIPTTLSLTTLGNKSPGWQFNLETDVFSKTIVSFLEKYKK